MALSGNRPESSFLQSDADVNAFVPTMVLATRLSSRRPRASTPNLPPSCAVPRKGTKFAFPFLEVVQGHSPSTLGGERGGPLHSRLARCGVVASVLPGARRASRSTRPGLLSMTAIDLCCSARPEMRSTTVARLSRFTL